MEECSVCLSVAEGVNVPTDFGVDSELVFEPLMSCVEVSDNILVVGRCLISSNPSTHGNFESSFFDELLYGSLCIFILSFVPHAEKLNLKICEFSFWVF